jgi:ABC-2 type transport system ATP-binding protein
VRRKGAYDGQGFKGGRGIEAALELVSVTKRFGRKDAVAGLSLRLEPGAFLGLLGRNGAGKSTTINLATGLLRPTEGGIRVLGLDLEANLLAVKRQIGVMPEELALLDRLTGAQYLRFVGRMYGLADEVIDARRGELFERLDLQPEPGLLICDYSYGMKKKLALSAALVHGPRLLFLDEPFEGIDPVTSRTIRQILEGLSRRGVTLVLTSHVLEIVEKLCPRVAILDEGRLCGHGTLEELRAQHGTTGSLEELFVSLMGGAKGGELSWL